MRKTVNVSMIKPALVAQDHFLARKFNRQQPLIEADDVLRDRPLGVQPRVLDRTHDLAELHDQHLLGLCHGEQTGAGDDGQHHDQRRPAIVTRFIGSAPTEAGRKAEDAARAGWRCRWRHVQRQERHQAPKLVIDDQRLRVGEHVLHGVQIHPAQGHVLGRLIGFQHAVEALRLAVCLGDRGCLGTLPLRNDAGGVTASPRHDVIAVGLGLVPHPFGVGIGALHVSEAFDHRSRGIDLLQLHLGDLHAGFVAIQNLLGLLEHVGLDLSAQRSECRLDRRAADHLAHRAFGHPRTSVSGLAVLNRNAAASLIRQKTATSMSMMFSSPVSIRLSARTSRPAVSWPVSTLPPAAER